MEVNLTGKTALVTGGNIGIGRGIALALAEFGAQVAITHYSNPETCTSTVEELKTFGSNGPCVYLDATDSAMVNTVTESAADALGGHIDILVNNAGNLVDRVLISEMDDAHWHRVIEVNLYTAFYCSRAALRHMPDGGRIINMASLAGRDGGGKGAVPYATAKAAIMGFTRGLAKEVAPRQITVNALSPGFIVNTPFHETFTGKDKYDGIIATIPLGRAGEPQDVAGTVIYLASALADWITGQVIEINGGKYFV